MSKKYTLMVFDAERMGRVRSLTISSGLIKALFLCVFVLLGSLGVSLFHMHTLYVEKGRIAHYNSETMSIENQISAYTSQINNLTDKISRLDELEFRIRDLVALQDDVVPLKPIAVGGREVDLLREYSSTASLQEKDFFQTLSETLQDLSIEVEKRELNLSDLAASLEENRIMMLSTPTIWPVKGWLSSQFGYRVSPFTNKTIFHEGIDIASRMGSDIVATASGTVIYAGYKSGLGQLVSIDHGYGYVTRYAHNSAINVKVGDKVEKGQIISKVGTSGTSTGPHLHYEVLVNGIPVNPMKFIIE